jgi:hypothetical protein
MLARDSLLLASIYWPGRDSRATLASPQPDRSSELDRHTAVWHCLRVDRVDATRVVRLPASAILPMKEKKAPVEAALQYLHGLAEIGIKLLRSRAS